GGGRGGPGGGNFGGGGSDFNVGQASGISKTNSAGINFSNVYAKKLTLSGSYFFNNSSNANESVVNTETFGDTTNQFSIEKSNSVTKNTNHRLNLRIEYKIDSANSLFIIPSVSFQKNSSSSLSTLQYYEGAGDSISNSRTNGSSDRHGYNIRNNIMFRHSFPKRGRSLSLGFNTTWNKNDGESITDSKYRFYKNGIITDSLQNRLSDNNTNGYTIGGNISYTEPIGKKGQLQFEYRPSVQKNKADQQTFSYDGQKYSMFDTTLSNRFDNTITTHNAGISYRLNQSRDEQLSFGVNFQTAKLESERIFPTTTSVDQSFTTILPNAMWRKKISTNANIRVFYRASTNFPSVTQLQDVVNLSNPLRVSSGNPDLDQSYTHFVSGRYSYTNSKTSRSFFANLLLQTASDYITNATYIPQQDSVIQQNIVLKARTQLTKPVNLDGYKSLRTFFTYSMPLKFIKTTLNLSAGFSYSKLPGLVNYQKTMTDSYGYNGGVVLASNISQYVDFNVSYNINLNESKTNTSNNTNSKYVNQGIGVQANLLSKKGWFLQNDISGNIYSGLSAGLNQSYWLWNAAIGKKFLKNNAGELKLSVFDLLKQNQSITRTVGNADIVDVQTKVLQQYFMLTFTYSLKNFGTAATRSGNNNNGGGFNRGGMREGGNGPF
ncbi:MAG: outer membrane beta-barrel protein, partial [Ferruginibacter sp.]